MEVDVSSGEWLPVEEVVKCLGISHATFKKRLRLLERYNFGQYGDDAPGFYAENLKKAYPFSSATELDRLESELDRCFPSWRYFPEKYKRGRTFYWQRSKIESYVDRTHGRSPLP